MIASVNSIIKKEKLLYSQNTENKESIFSLKKDIERIGIAFLSLWGYESFTREQDSEKQEIKNILRESFGLWKTHDNVSSSIEYVNELRKSWDKRLEP